MRRQMNRTPTETGPNGPEVTGAAFGGVAWYWFFYR